MFTLNHFIWLALAALVALLFIRYDKKHGEIAALSLLCGCCIASECIKLYSNITVTPEGATLPTEVLPFHLCSMQILVIYALRFSKNEGLRRHLYEFCWPTATFGAICALLIPTEGVSFFETPHTWEYFLFHGLLIGFGITIVRRFGSTFNGKSYIACLAGVGIACWIAIYMNALTGENFMFMMRPPMENLPYLNMNAGWLSYFLRIGALAVFILTACYLPFILRARKQKKAAAAK